MNLLLDTHVIIWALTDDERLSDYARNLIYDDNNVIYYSIASIWEIAIKNYKSPVKCPYNELEIDSYCKKAGFLPMDIRVTHIGEIRNLRVRSEKVLKNQDPFDRIMIAQAKSEGYKILSHDTNFFNYDEPCIMLI